MSRTGQHASSELAPTSPATSISLKLMLRLLWREWQSGELRLLMLALLVAVTASCAVGFFTDRVERAMISQAQTFLGADLVVRTSRPFQMESRPVDLRQQASQFNLNYSEQQVFASMLMSGTDMLLSSIKVVDEAYPLKGELKISKGLDQPAESVTRGPEPGTLWVEPRILQALNAEVGDTIELGASEFQLAYLLMHEPDRSGGWFSLQPRAIMAAADLPATQVIQPGSRVRYRYLFDGADTNVAAFREWVEPLLQTSERILDIHEENRSLGNTLSRASNFLNMAGLLAVVMAGIAIAMATRRYCERHFDSAALLRCLGQSQRQIMKLFILQLLTAGTLISLVGVLCGWLAQYALVSIMSGLIPVSLPGPGLTPALTGFSTGLMVLLGFALPPILRLSKVTPLRVLRRELTPLPTSAWLAYGLAAVLLTLLFWLYTRDIALTLMTLGTGAIAAIILGALTWQLLRQIVRIPGGLSWRLASRNLVRHRSDSLAQLFAFGLTLCAMALILSVRTDLVNNWEERLPDNAPNYFLINIQPFEVERLESYFAEHDIDSSGLYPMVRGRLSQVNGQPAKAYVEARGEGRYSIRRELNLTFSDTLSPDNKIVEGRWWQPGDEDGVYISIEDDLAGDLGVGIGDTLSFTFADQQVTAEILSLRSLQWESMNPNFFVVFNPGALEGLPANYITSFHLPSERSQLATELMKQFPTLTLLEIDQLLSNIRNIIAQVSIGVQYVMLFVLFAGITVLLAALVSSIDERLREGALLRTIGADSATLKRMLNIEFLLIGGLAGGLAAATTEVVCYVVYGYLFDLDYQVGYWRWLVLPLSGATLVCITGRFGARRITRQSPMGVLREL